MCCACFPLWIALEEHQEWHLQMREIPSVKDVASRKAKATIFKNQKSKIE
jgi:hypothetical protein